VIVNLSTARLSRAEKETSGVSTVCGVSMSIDTDGTFGATVSIKYPDSVCEPELPASSVAEMTKLHESSIEILQFTIVDPD
jgi:hypothetical protein